MDHTDDLLILRAGPAVGLQSVCFEGGVDRGKAHDFKLQIHPHLSLIQV